MEDFRIVALILWICIIVLFYIFAKLYYKMEYLEDRIRDLEYKEEKNIANGKQ